MSSKLSIIIPVYNIEKYIKACLDSLIHAAEETQTELICVDDKSTDSSLAILEEYAAAYPAVVRIVRHEQNRGLSAARNSGLKIARAEYLAFIDGDDLVAPHYLEVSLGILEKYQPDMVLFSFASFDNERGCNKNGGILWPRMNFTNHYGNFSLEGLVTKSEDLRKLVFLVSQYTWVRIFHRKLFFDHEIFFPETFTHFEDIPTIPRLSFFAKSVYVMNYYMPILYRTNVSTSLSFQNIDRMSRKFHDLCRAFDLLRAFLQENKAEERYRVELETFRNDHLFFYVSKGLVYSKAPKTLRDPILRDMLAEYKKNPFQKSEIDLSIIPPLGRKARLRLLSLFWKASLIKNEEKAVAFLLKKLTRRIFYEGQNFRVLLSKGIKLYFPSLFRLYLLGKRMLSRKAMINILLFSNIFFSTHLDAEIPILKPPAGLFVSLYAEVPGARQMARAWDESIFVASHHRSEGGALYWIESKEKGPQKILDGLKQSIGVAYSNGDLYVSQTDRIMRYRKIRQTLAEGKTPQGEILLGALLDNRHHGGKVLEFGPDGLLYFPIGAPCNVCLPQKAGFGNATTASIMRLHPDNPQGSLQVVASGVRNSVGMTWDASSTLFFTDNGRDGLGRDLPADELNRLDSLGAHYGFPYRHAGGLRDPEFGTAPQGMDFVDVFFPLGPHAAALGLTFYDAKAFPALWHGALLIAEHGSWLKGASDLGYRVSAIQLDSKGRVRTYGDFLSGFVDQDGTIRGRPSDVLVGKDGSVFVSDDMGGRIWQILAAEADEEN